jgi:hypothetical protein
MLSKKGGRVNRSATLFPTITSADWKQSLARARAEGNVILQQIRARCAPTTSRTVEQRLDRHPHKVEGPGFDSPAVHPLEVNHGRPCPTDHGPESIRQTTSHKLQASVCGNPADARATSAKLSSGSPFGAGLAMTHETSDGAKECRKALTRQVVPEVVRRCETPRANDCPPLESFPWTEDPRDVEEVGQRGGAHHAAATASPNDSTGSHPTKQANERSVAACENSGAPLSALPHDEDKSRADDQRFEASSAARENFQNP